jgi:lysozyme
VEEHVASPKIVDLSRYQEGFDFKDFKDGGGIAVICKASEGTTLADVCYKGFREEAKSVGLAFASYHFLRPGDMEDQAKWYLNCAVPEHGERVVADYEDYNVSLDDLVEFLKEVKRIRPSLQLTVYGSNVLEEEIGSKTNSWLTSNTSLWTAAYSSSPGQWPKQVWPVWSLWQYTDDADVDGFDGPVDGNKFNGSDEQCLEWFGPAGAGPEPVSEATVSIVVTGKVKVVVNGKTVT